MVTDAETLQTKVKTWLMVRNLSHSHVLHIKLWLTSFVMWYSGLQNNFFLVSKLFPHSDLMHMNTPKFEEQLRNSGCGAIQGARECSIRAGVVHSG